MDFSDLLASSVHDIKNSLGVVSNTLEALAGDADSGFAADPRALALQLMVRRANDQLIQLLNLYKLQNEPMNASLVEQDLEDFLEDLVVENRRLGEAGGICMESRCVPSSSAFFDRELVRGVLNSAIGNASRYTRNRVLISAETLQGFTVIRVEDNGPGFPPEMLDAGTGPNPWEGFGTDRTRLGLYFSLKVARAHRNGDRRGFIRLENTHRLEGGCFSIWLP